MTTDERNQECGKHLGEHEGGIMISGRADFKQCLEKGYELAKHMVALEDKKLAEVKQCLNYQHCQGFVGCAKDANGKLITGYKTNEGLCSSCTHWDELIRNQHLNPEIIFLRVNGRHYQTHLNDINKPPGKYSGFGGRKFVVKQIFNQGLPDVFYTCNMWTQGTIPEHYREKLPDNAEFVNEVTETVVFDGRDFITCFD